MRDRCKIFMTNANSSKYGTLENEIHLAPNPFTANVPWLASTSTSPKLQLLAVFLGTVVIRFTRELVGGFQYFSPVCLRESLVALRSIRSGIKSALHLRTRWPRASVGSPSYSEVLSFVWSTTINHPLSCLFPHFIFDTKRY